MSFRELYMPYSKIVSDWESAWINALGWLDKEYSKTLIIHFFMLRQVSLYWTVFPPLSLSTLGRSWSGQKVEIPRIKFPLGRVYPCLRDTCVQRVHHNVDTYVDVNHSPEPCVLYPSRFIQTWRNTHRSCPLPALRQWKEEKQIIVLLFCQRVSAAAWHSISSK